MRALPLIAVFLLAQQQRETVRAGMTCVQAVYALPEAAPYRAHVSENLINASLAQLSDASYPTPLEIVSIEAVHRNRHACLNDFIAKLDQLAPTISPIYRRVESEADDDLVSLIQHRLTLGEAIQRGRDRGLAGQEAILQEEKRIAAEDQAGAQALQDALVGLAIINAASQPRVTFPPAPSSGVITVTTMDHTPIAREAPAPPPPVCSSGRRVTAPLTRRSAGARQDPVRSHLSLLSAISCSTPSASTAAISASPNAAISIARALAHCSSEDGSPLPPAARRRACSSSRSRRSGSLI
jgi:hypothetical protein